MTGELRELLLEATASVPPARLAEDTWRRGRRARRRARVRTVAAVGLVTALVAVIIPLWTGGRAPARTGDGGDWVPAELALPWMWQATVRQDPPGRASVLFGGDTIGLRGSDIFDSEGKLAVVGRGGKTRMLLYSGIDSIAAGEDVLLSPDGRRVAQSFLEDPDVSTDGLIVTDLANGRSTTVRGTSGPGCCVPVAWAPDGASILATQASEDIAWVDNRGQQRMRFVLVDLTTGTTMPLGDYQLGQYVRSASRGAFAPDGRRMAITEGTTVRLLDRAGATVWSRDLGPRRYLAGVGAFSPDGARIATVTLDGCLDGCDEAALAARRWAFGYLDARTGADVSGPGLAPVTGSAVRALGWSQGGSLVALRYTPEHDAHKTTPVGWNDTGWYETGHITLIALGPDGSVATLLDPPDGVLTMDVAADLLAAGRFGGPASSASILPARGRVLAVALIPVGCLLAVLVPVAVFVVARVRRRIRGVSPPARPAGSTR